MNCLDLLAPVTEKVLLAGKLLTTEWARQSGLIQHFMLS